jgi:NitT/TauT family transport system ATP-binding protein
MTEANVATPAHNFGANNSNNLPPVIQLTDVTVGFDGHMVLEGVNLRVEAGEFIALIGPSGGGKSTLLRVIAGLLRTGDKHVTGQVAVVGRPAVVFQDYRLLPWRTVRQNVALPLEVTGRGDEADGVLKNVGMQDYAHLYPHQLSGGMRARVAIARAFAQDAEVLLMDEPFAALDALVRERFNEEMKKLHAKTGKTIIFVTHSIREAVYLADRVAVLKNGQLEAIYSARGEGRVTAFTEGLEGELRIRLGLADSTSVEPTPPPLKPPWEIFGVLGLTLLFFGGWSWLATQLNPLFFASPWAVARAFLDSPVLFLEGTLATLRVFTLSLLASLAIGVPTGYLMGRFRVLERLLSPFIVALQATPTVIIAPLLVFALGYGLGSQVIIATLISLFPVLVSTMVGVREVERVYREVFETMGATPWRIFTKLEVPGALPVILGGLRLTVSLALIGTVVGEFTLGGNPGNYGLGYLAQDFIRNQQPDRALAAVAMNVLLGLALYLLVSIIEMWVLRYRKQ